MYSSGSSGAAYSHSLSFSYIVLQADTAKVIWAYHSVDPVSLRGLGSLRHQQMGSTSLNLLGGTNDERNITNTSFFVISNENVRTEPQQVSIRIYIVYNNIMSYAAAHP